MKKKLSNKQRDYITLSTILAFFALMVYVVIMLLNLLIRSVF